MNIPVETTIIRRKATMIEKVILSRKPDTWGVGASARMTKPEQGGD